MCVCVLPGKYVFDREVVDAKLKEGEEQIHHDLEKFKDKLLKHSVSAWICDWLILSFIDL